MFYPNKCDVQTFIILKIGVLIDEFSGKGRDDVMKKLLVLLMCVVLTLSTIMVIAVSDTAKIISGITEAVDATNRDVTGQDNSQYVNSDLLEVAQNNLPVMAGTNVNSTGYTITDNTNATVNVDGIRKNVIASETFDTETGTGTQVYAGGNSGYTNTDGGTQKIYNNVAYVGSSCGNATITLSRNLCFYGTIVVRKGFTLTIR